MTAATRSVLYHSALALLIGVVSANIEIVSENSFRPPFKDFDSEGSRSIENWAYGGSTFVNENFVRLTPDRASKRGWLWNLKRIGIRDFTVTLRFRVSGQGKNLFGDGFALWFTDQPRHVEGSIHGFTDTFQGFGLAFDTFRNTEAGHVHKDIALLINDGSGPITTATANTPGCDADFRYHEGRDDFQASRSKSAAKISFRDGMLNVHIDARDQGDFIQCITNYRIPLPDQWAEYAYIGLTATTGQLADNHDIVSLLLSPQDIAIPESTFPPPLPISAGSNELDMAIKSQAEVEVHKLEEKLAHIHHHLEHQMTAVEDGMKSTVQKLRDLEENNAQRITALENKLRDQMKDHVGVQLAERLRVLEEKLTSRYKYDMDRKISKAKSGWGYFIAVALLSVVTVGGAVYIFRTYNDLKKTHLP